MYNAVSNALNAIKYAKNFFFYCGTDPVIRAAAAALFSTTFACCRKKSAKSKKKVRCKNIPHSKNKLNSP